MRQKIRNEAKKQTESNGGKKERERKKGSDRIKHVQNG